MRNAFLFLLSLTILLMPACEEGFEVNAPYQDIWAVYGILHQEDSVQYIRISKAFQPESNAFEQAASEDFTVKGLTVSLTGNGLTYQATQIDSLTRDPDGDFYPEMTLYRFDTGADQPLAAGETYQLLIRADSLEGFELRAETRIPPKPDILRPNIRKTQTKFCLQTLALEDSFEVVFRTKEDPADLNEALLYEIRIRMAYEADGETKQYVYGPTRPFSSSKGCAAGLNDALCYEFGNGVVLNAMQGHFLDPFANYRYRAFPNCDESRSLLSRDIKVEVTAIDTVLGRYMQANDPRYFNVNTVRPEYTNVEGTEKAVGILGSISSEDIPIGISECSRFALFLNNTPDPGYCE